MGRVKHTKGRGWHKRGTVKRSFQHICWSPLHLYHRVSGKEDQGGHRRGGHLSQEMKKGKVTHINKTTAVAVELHRFVKRDLLSAPLPRCAMTGRNSSPLPAQAHPHTSDLDSGPFTILAMEILMGVVERFTRDIFALDLRRSWRRAFSGRGLWGLRQR